MSRRQRVSIVGGGVGGLTLAAALDPARHDVTIIEAAPDRAVIGGGLGLWPAAQRALRRIGAWDALAPAATGSSGGEVGGTLYATSGQPLVSLGSTPLRIVGRPALLAALDAAVPPSVRRVTAQVEDPAALDGDVVVGADGVRSRVRGLVWAPADQRVATDYVALRGTPPVARLGVDPARHVGEYWGPGRLFGFTPLGLEHVYWFTTHRWSAHGRVAPGEPLDVAAVLAQARETFAGAAPIIGRVLARTDPTDDVTATRMWVAPPMPRYTAGRYVVLGDAAHASLPNLGRGACDAILDAATLAGALEHSAPGALLAWQARRLPPTQAARVTASALMRVALLDRGHAARDRLLHAAGALTRPR